ncbi:MAG: polysaccharide deacetylase family protein [Magnetovibrio sp.]|nr:polysaccharide deacetylase family protein [Magnetovibrio sp.]
MTNLNRSAGSAVSWRHRLAVPWLTAWRLYDSLRPRRQGFRILLFHDVPESQLGRFERLVDHVRETHGILSPEQAAAWIETGAPAPAAAAGRRAPCLLSFDDGFVSNHRLAARILAPRGLTGLFFVCPGLVDLAGDAQRQAIAARVFNGRRQAGDLADDERMMSWPEIEDLRAQGHTVGCHGLSHRRLSELDGGELEEEIGGGADLLATRLGGTTPWYAFSFGDVGSVSPKALAMIGERFRFCRSGVRGLNTPATPPGALLAEQIDLSAPPAYQNLVAEGGLDFRYGAARARLSAMAAG